MRNRLTFSAFILGVCIPFLLSLSLYSCNSHEVIELEVNSPAIVLDSESGIYIVKVGRSVTIIPTVTEATNPVIYTWKQKGKIVGDKPIYTFSVTQTSEYFVVFRVDASNGFAEEELRVYVVDKLPPLVSLPYLQAVINTDLVIKSAVGNAEEGEFSWMLNGDFVSSDTAFVFHVSDTGQYTLKVTITNEDGSASASMNILAFAEPEMNVYFEKEQVEIMSGRAYCLAPIISDATGKEVYEWKVNDEIVPNESFSTYKFTPIQAGKYVVSVTVRDEDLEKTASVEITCLQLNELTHYRPVTFSSSATQVTVLEFMPAPG